MRGLGNEAKGWGRGTKRKGGDARKGGNAAKVGERGERVKRECKPAVGLRTGP